jgi:phage-related protein
MAERTYGDRASKELKDVEWVGSSYKDLMETGEDVKDAIGYALERAQAGELAGYAEPMKGSLRDVIEIRTPGVRSKHVSSGLHHQVRRRRILPRHL